MSGAEDATPVVENKSLTGTSDTDHGDTPTSEIPEDTPTCSAVTIPSVAKRLEDSGDMSQSYHEIFDTQGYNKNRDNTENIQDKEESNRNKTVEVYYSEGEGKLISVSPPSGSAQTPMSQYLTSKLVADSLMWQETFRNDSPSPDDPSPGMSRPSSLCVNETVNDQVHGQGKISVIDTGVINDIEKDARRLATDVDAMIENLSCILQSISALTVEHVQTYRDGVCKTCDSVDSNIRAMYQLMAKWEELNKNMAPAYRISSQIKDIKRLLDMFEAALN